MRPEKPSKDEVRRVVKHLGSSPKMSVEEKELFLEQNANNIFTNYDFVNPATYQRIFEGLSLENKNVVLVGAGYPFAGSGASNLTKALASIRTDANLIPIDLRPIRAKSWLLLDDEREGDQPGLDINPVVADGTKLPFGDDSVALYVSTNLINEPNKQDGESYFVRKLLAEAYRVLTPGGTIVLSSFGYFRYTNKEGGVFYNDDLDVEEMVPKEMIVEFLRAAGFKDIEELPLDHEEALRAIKNKKNTVMSASKVEIVDACAFTAHK